MWFALMLLAAGRLAWAGCAAAFPVVPSVRSHRVDLNRAPIAELQTLPGIGPARAQAIVLHRLRHGWFRCLEDLTAVDGIGPATLAELLPFLADPAAPDSRPGG